MSEELGDQNMTSCFQGYNVEIMCDQQADQNLGPASFRGDKIGIMIKQVDQNLNQRMKKVYLNVTSWDQGGHNLEHN
jgi:hypothetical protein